jgi:predicted Zn-dependent protease
MARLRTLLLLSLLALPARAADDPRRALLGAMRDELQRSMARLRLPGYEAPYYIAFAVRDYDRDEVTGKLGALYEDHHKRERHAYVQVRVGDYQFDNTSDESSSLFDLDAPETWQAPTEAPIDDDPTALRDALWLLADEKYKHALADYARKRGRRATAVSEDEGLPSFCREPPVSAVEPADQFPFDRSELGARARRASALFRRHPDLFDGAVKLNVERVVRYLVTSEGTELVTDRAIYGAYLSAATRAADGMLLEHEKSFYVDAAADLPDDAALAKAVEELATELRALREAPVIDPYTGPAILMPQAAGVFFHEAVGHRLEGERQNNEKEGRTFKGQIGQRILPEFLSVHDDPTRRRAGAAKPQSLNGYYRYDDEGVPARDVALIERGVLRDYLMSRTPIRGSLRSNGHGRAEGNGDPMGRMANLIVTSTRRVSEEKLKKLLLEEVHRQGKPFGLVIRDITGGATNTSNYGFQAFKGQPRLVYRVDARTGTESLVRGVEMVGTPLASINKIVATSDREGVFNGFCGAESGFVPVSTVAPAVLMSEIELQRSERALERPQILPPPWQAGNGTEMKKK